ncbi:MAG: hypothetical protein KatS3mg023_1033 [Armatimonadota bacterium]|nr:MAG: hypothetical protein KatS3mg023_1033 [Armatimonadota bacterium]
MRLPYRSLGGWRRTASALFCVLSCLLPLTLFAAPEDPVMVFPRLTPEQVRPVLSPDGSLLAVPGTMGSVLVFNANTGELVRVLTGLGGGSRGVVFSRDGQYLLSVSHSSWQLRVRVWRTSTWVLYKEAVFDDTWAPQSLALSPDNRWLAVGAWGHAYLFDLNNLERTELQGIREYVQGLDFSPDGQYLATASSNDRAILWRVSDWGRERVLAEGLSEPVDLRFSPDGNYLALSSSGGNLYVWRTTSWDAPLYTKELGTFASSSSRHVPLAFSLDSQRLAVRFGSTSWQVSTVKVYNVSDGAELRTVDVGNSQYNVNYVYGIALRDNDLFVGVRGSSPNNVDERIMQWNVTTGEVTRQITGPTTNEISWLELSPDGSKMAIYNHYSDVRVVDTSSGQVQIAFPNTRGGNVSISPDGSRLWVSGNGSLYSLADGTRLWQRGEWSEGLFSPDGQYLVVRSEGWYSSDYYDLLDANTGATVRSFEQRGTAVRHSCLTPDGKYLLSAARAMGWNWDNGFRVWRVQDGVAVFDQEWGAKTVDITPSGNTIALGVGVTLMLKQAIDTGDTLQFSDIRAWQAHGGDVHRVRFAPNGMALVSVGEDAAVKVWRIMDAGLQYNLKGHVEAVYDVAVARSGSDLLVAAGGWGGVALWRVPMPGAGNTPASVPQVLYPAPNADVDNWVLRFQANDPDENDRLRFRVEIMAQDGSLVRQFDQTADDRPFDKPDATGGEVVTLNLDADMAPGVYRFRVRATDGWSWSDWSEERTFTLVKPVLPLGEQRTLRLNGGRWRATIHVPEGAEKLFVASRSVEQATGQVVHLYRDGSPIAEQTAPDVFIEQANPAAGQYEVEIVPGGAAQLVVFASTALPTVRLGGRYTGTIYRSDGYDWLQMDVPEGVQSLEFTVDAPGNVTELSVWRGRFGSWENWSASQHFNPPVKLTIRNPRAGRYYLRIMDHGQLNQTQVRQYTLSLSGAQASLTASVTPTMASAGSPDPVTFTVQYSNTGNAPAASVVLKCVLPEGLNVVESSLSEGGTYDADTRTAQWNLGNLAAGASGSVSFRANVAREAPSGTNLSVQVSLESSDLAETATAQVTLWVGAAGVTFDNVHTMFNFVNVTVGGLSINREQGTPRVWLEFPAGTAVSTEVDAEEVTISEDGTQVTARFALMDKVLENVAPKLRMSHPSMGTQEWQAPTLQVFGIGSEMRYNKPFLRMGRSETVHVQVTNPNSTWETPFVKIQFDLANVPSDETATITYKVLAPNGMELKAGNTTALRHEVGILLPQLAPGATADYRIVLKVNSSRSALRTRIEPMTIAIVTVVSGVAIISSWAGHSILQSGCEKAIKRRLREDFALEGVDLTDQQINNLYNAYRQAGSFAAAWLSELAKSGVEKYTVDGFKDYITGKYGSGYAKAAELAYKVAKGEHPMETLLGEIASQLAPDLEWPLLPATAAVKAFLAEGQDCIEKGKELRQLAERFQKRRRTNPPQLRITRSWDPNAKSGTYGVDGFIPDGQTIDYTVCFENQPTATAAAEEVLIEDILDENLDDSTLVFTGFGFGSNEVTLPVPTGTLSQGVDLGNNLVVRVESSYDPSSRKLTVRFKGIDTRTGDYHEDGFLPPNNNEPEGEGYVSFRIRPKADVSSGTRIVNKATITFDAHLGQNPPMETNEHALTLDKQAPQIAIADMPAVQTKPTFTLSWQGDDDSSGIAQAEIWYSTDGGAFQLWRALSPEENRQQTGSATFQGKFGYTYRFYAVGADKVGNRSAIPSEPQAAITAGVAPEMAAGLQLIALPVVSEEADAKRVLNFDTDKLAAYIPGSGYVRYPNTALQVGRGYWVQLPSAQRASIRGDVADEAQSYVIPLQQGWNLIGNPWLESIAWHLSAIQVEQGGQSKSLSEAQAAGWVEDYAWGWDGTKYVLVYDSNIVSGVNSHLEAWRGYWVYAHQACNLILPSPSAGRAARSRRAEGSRGAWSFPVRVQVGSESAEVTVGISAGSRGLSVGLPPEPPIASGKRVKLSILQSGQAYVVDVRRSTGKQVWDLQAEWPAVEEPSSPVVLTFGNVASVPRGTALWLVDRTTGKRHYVRTTASYRFTPSQGETTRQFQLVAEPETSVGLKITGVGVTRTRGGAFHVTFHLTSPAALTAEVLSASGRPVVRLNPFGGRAVEGMQSLTWRGTDENGVALPAGAYLLQLQATDDEGRQSRVNIPLVLTR